MMELSIVCVFDISMTWKQLCEQYQYLPKVKQFLPRTCAMIWTKKFQKPGLLSSSVDLFSISSYKLHLQRNLSIFFTRYSTNFDLCFYKSAPCSISKCLVRFCYSFSRVVYSDVNKSFTIYALGFYIFIGQRPIILIPFFYFRNVSLTSKFRDAWRDDCCFGNWYGNSGIKQFRLTVYFYT